MNVKCILFIYFLIQYTIVCVHFNRQRLCDAAKGIIVGNVDTKIERGSFNWNLLGLATRCPRGQPSAKYWSNMLRAFNTFAAIVDRSRFNNSCLRLLKISDDNNELKNQPDAQ
jgi:hypothetical protein